MYIKFIAPLIDGLKNLPNGLIITHKIISHFPELLNYVQINKTKIPNFNMYNNYNNVSNNMNNYNINSNFNMKNNYMLYQNNESQMINNNNMPNINENFNNRFDNYKNNNFY